VTDLQHIRRPGTQPLRDGEPVHWLERDHAQDENVQCALNKICGSAHVVSVTDTMP
jgi:hypothetical protein